MGSEYLTGKGLQKAILVGSRKVIDNTEELNRINVFPVPDGDTGSNMASTFESISKAALEDDGNNPSLDTVSNRVADSALNGARGNSGAILAQFFQGLAQGFDTKAKVGVKHFSQAVNHAVTSTRDAISNPVEGTIITVMHDWAHWIKEHYHNHPDFESLMQRSLVAAKKSLKETPDKLEVLAKANVVDAGAQGFVNFLQGVVDFIENPKASLATLENIKKNIKEHKTKKPITSEGYDDIDIDLSPAASHSGEIEYQYCTECIIHGHDINLKAVKQELKAWGDSMVVVGNPHKLKLHIHTNAPERIFKLMSDHGEILETKADDMWAQYRANIGWHINKDIALMSDTTCAIPQEIIAKYNIMMIPLQILVDNKPHLDKINITKAEFYSALKDPKKTVATSQPSPIDYRKTFEKAASRYRQAIGIFVSDNLSGTYRSAINMADQFKEFQTHLYNSNNVSGGLGLIVEAAAQAIHARKSMDEIDQTIKMAINNCVTYAAPAMLDYLIKGGRLSAKAGRIAKTFGLLPIIKVDSDGRANKAGIGFGQAMNRNKIVKLVCKKAETYKDPRFSITHADAPENANKYANAIRKKFPNATIHVLYGAPSLATHSGPGTLSISVLGLEEK